VLSRSLGRDAATTRRVALAGRLHDVGKIVIPDAVLGKPGELSTQEWDLLVRHPDHGARLVRVVPGFAAVAESIRQHHERVDGTGYPVGLQGTDIRVEARIIAVCDSWAAMRAARAYQAALPEDHAREQLRTGRGTQFAPDLVDLFLSLRDGGQIDDLALLG
jgi:two-component system cell cycle response regulator